MSKWLLGFVFVLLVLGLVSGGTIQEDVSRMHEGRENNTLTRVVIYIDKDDSSGFKVASSDEKKINIHRDRIKYVFDNKIVAFVTNEELEELKNYEGIGRIKEEVFFHIYLQDAVEIQSATEAWELNVGGLNLDGEGQTICLIDTGVNYNHADFGGCYGDNNISSDCKIMGGYDFCADDGSCAGSDDDPLDVNGHGTHVAGIISANGSIKGIAPSSKIIMIKAGNSSGGFAPTDIEKGLEWCIDNATKFNISVISMSLGGNSYSSTCDSEYPDIVALIDAAEDAGISVTVATGNDGYTDKIGFPSCVSSAIPVSSVSKSDVFAPSANRNSLVKLLGIGGISSGQINSTSVSGGYTSKYGTSMATPMVAGAIAILNQHLKSTGQIRTPLEIEDILYNSGIVVSELGNNYSRINVYDALLSLDNVAPEVNLISPVSGHVNLSSNQSFSCNFSDWQLENVTFRIWNSSGILHNESYRNLSGRENGTIFSLGNFSKGDYEWNCFASDSLGNLGVASDNFSFTVGEIEVSLDFPVNGSYANVNETIFGCSVRSDSSYELANISFYLWNSSGVLMKNESQDISGFENESNFSYTFLVDDGYLWECVAYNNNSDMGGGVNFSVSYDSREPVVSGLDVDASKTSAVISWTTDEISNSSIWIDSGAWSNSSDLVLSHSVLVSSLSASTNYSYYVSSCDLAGNCVIELASFFTDEEVVLSSGGGSGGGGSGGVAGVKIIEVEYGEFLNGKSELIGIGDIVNFNLVSGKHSLEVRRVGVDFADIVVMSEPVYLTLKVGEEVRLNLSSPDYFDLVVGLNGVLNGKANVSVMRIFEEIVFEEVVDDFNESEEERVFRVTDEKEKSWWVFVLAGIGILILVGVIFANRKEVKEGRVVKKKKKHEMKRVLKHLKEHSGSLKKV
jgi:subtilisin family serine protease